MGPEDYRQIWCYNLFTYHWHKTGIIFISSFQNLTLNLNLHHTCQLFLFWRNSSSFRSKKENDFIMCSCFCSNLCIVMYRKFRNVPLFKFFSLICSSFWNLKVGKYAYTQNHFCNSFIEWFTDGTQNNFKKIVNWSPTKQGTSHAGLIWDMDNWRWHRVKNNSSVNFEIFVFYIP